MSQNKPNAKSTPQKRKRGAPKKAEASAIPLMTATASHESLAHTSETSYRRNKAGSIERTDKFTNIENGLIPFKLYSGAGQTGISIRDAVILCQKAYYNFSVFRNTIDLMT